MEYRTIPDDFLPVGALPKDDGAYDKYFSNYYHFFGRRPGEKENQGGEVLQVSLAVLKGNVQSMKSFAVEVAKTGVNKYYSEAFNQAYPGFTFKKGGRIRHVTSLLDFNDALKQNTYGKEMRSMAFFTLHTVWGANNEWAIDLEQEILNHLQMEYSGKRFDGSVMVRNHRGGCFKAIGVAQKNSMLKPTKKCLKERHQEGLCRRNRTGLIATKVDGNGVEICDDTFDDSIFNEDSDTENSDDSDDEGPEEDTEEEEKKTKSKKKKKKKKSITPPKALRKVLLANETYHGIQDGYILVFEDHPSLAAEKSLPPPGLSTPKKMAKNELSAILDQIPDGGSLTKDQFKDLFESALAPTPTKKVCGKKRCNALQVFPSDNSSCLYNREAQT